MTTTEPRQVIASPRPNNLAPGGPISQQAIDVANSTGTSPAGSTSPRPARRRPEPKWRALGGDPNSTVDHRSIEPQFTAVDGGPNPQQATHDANSSASSPAGSTSPRPARDATEPIDASLGGDPNSTVDQSRSELHAAPVDGGPNPGLDQGSCEPQTRAVEAGLLDPTLLIAAEIVDDLEKTRVANENRLRQLTRDQVDADGGERGFGLPTDHPAVARIASIVEGLGKLEHEAVLNIKHAMGRHPLGPWVKAQRGIGEKQAARLLAAIGDPYWNTLHDRPRTVSELWAYCGYHVLNQTGGSDTGQAGGEAQIKGAGVAPRRTKGKKSNWSEDARKRSWLIVQSVIIAGGPWREVYDDRKANTEGKLHHAECVRCGPKNNPAKVGSPWSDGHRHADAIRITGKAILKALWIESRRLHGEAS